MPRLTQSERENLEQQIHDGGLTIKKSRDSFVVRDRKRRGKQHGQYRRRGWAVRQALAVIQGRTAETKVMEILEAEKRLMR